jgi:hypothetical protein
MAARDREYLLDRSFPMETDTIPDSDAPTMGFEVPQAAVRLGMSSAGNCEQIDLVKRRVR